MPLQWLPLDLSRYDKQPPTWGGGRQGRQPRSAVSEALRKPLQQGPVGGGFAAAGGLLPNKFVEEQKAKWAEEDKLKKLERDAQLAKAQEIGMRVQDDAQKKQEATMAQLKEQSDAKQKIEADPETAAKEYYNMMLSMPEDTQNVLLNQLFTPVNVGSFISAGGMKKDMPPKYNVMAQMFLTKGWATIDKTGNPVLSDPERVFEKTTFSIVEKGGKVYKLNTATGETTLLGSKDEPEKTIDEINKDANAQALAIAKASVGTGTEISFPEAKFDILKDSYDMSDEEASELSKIQEMPKDPNKLPWYKKVINWFKNLGEMPEDWQPKGAGKPAFNEAKVAVLVDVISDDVTEAERAHFKTQGASDADIDEAIKRKGIK